MKTSIKTIAATFVFAALFAFNASAEDKETKKAAAFGTGIYVAKSGAIHVSVDKYVPADAVLLLTDQSGKVIYQERMNKKTDKFRKQLNVSGLPAGSYTIEISSDGQKTTRDFELTDQKMSREISIR